MNEISATSENFDKEVLASSLPVVVDFWATWCGPCRMLAPVIEQLASELSGKIKVAKVNVDDQPALADKYNINAIPAVFLFENGEVKAKSIGFCDVTALKARLGL